MTKVDINKWEQHNTVVTNGKLAIRPGLFSHKLPTSGTVYQAGFSVESSTTTEVWHYLVERTTATGVCVVRVYTEDLLEMYSYDIGVCSGDAVFTYALTNGQIMVNSPSMSAPLYGIVGGGLTTAIKQPSINPDTTAINIPTGHTCTFGDRVAIASGRTVYFSDPDIDPRTYVQENTWVVDGRILDLLVGGDGSLYAFTSNTVFTLASDALGKGQQVTGFTSTIPGIYPSRPRNAAASNGQVAVLTADGMLLVGGKRQTDLAPYQGRRYWSLPVEVDDLRVYGQIFPTPDGFVVCFPGEPFMLNISIRDDFTSYVWTKTQQPINAVGVLKGRDGDTLYVLRGRIAQLVGTLDFDGEQVRGVACGELEMPPDKAGVVRSITVSSDSVGESTVVFAGGSATTGTTAIRPIETAPTTVMRPGDSVIGTTLWNTSARMSGRSLRSTLHRTVARDGDLHVEVGANGAGRRLGGVDVQVTGQARQRRDRGGSP